MKTMRNLIIILTGVLVIAAGSTTSWAVKPENPGKPVKKAVLDSTLCNGLGGTWVENMCTIPQGTTATANSGFTIPAQVSLVVNGDLHVGYYDFEDPTLKFDPQLIYEFSIDNSGSITVHKALFNLRTINNSGTITVDSEMIDENNQFGGIFNMGAINNSGTINVQNSTFNEGQYLITTVGINNVGAKIDTINT
ncbi:MAG TPA: hypothetical protein VK885_06250, partial [Desulfotignum sp.]|nr:hypothetical protein [Desulfotignum sp.]